MSVKTDLLKLAMEVDAAEKTSVPANLSFTADVQIDFRFGDISQERDGSWRVECTAQTFPDKYPLWSGVFYVVHETRKSTITPMGSIPASFLKALRKMKPETWDFVLNGY